jgi:hypothetical protein
MTAATNFFEQKYLLKLELLNKELLDQIDFSVKFPCEEAFIKIKETRKSIYETKQELKRLGISYEAA